ncbi:OmpP1/FadL family transporter [Celeribacter marinus]|uniref:OmpP1/FadL family transporter n=1 Tax=Celeribacter marinus TaxID=1397108 RepID=UPI003F6B09E4
MKLKLLTSAAIFGALAAPALAGSLERNNIPVELLFDSGNVVKLSYTAPRPNLSAAPFGSTGSVLNDFSTLGFAFKTDVNDDLALGVFLNQPFGADNGYASGGFEGYAIDFVSNEVAVVLSYQLNDNLSVHGGLRAVKSELDLAVPFAPYALNTGTDNGIGYLLGASYLIPERGARLTLTYNSSVQHDFDSKTTFEAAPDFVVTVPTQSEAKLPQSLKLDGEIALNSKTLLFGSVKWSDYSNFDIGLIDYKEDNINVSVGLGRSINDEWSVFGVLEAQLKDGEETALRPYDGSQALTLGARYSSGQYEVTAGVQYRQFGDAAVGVDGVVGPQPFGGNSAVSPFLTLAYSF